MKAPLLFAAITICWLGGVYGYEPSLYEAERLQTAEKLLWSAPLGMQKDIQEKLIKHESIVEDERKRFCVQYLLYQIEMITKTNNTTATTSTYSPGLVTKVIDKNTFAMRIDEQLEIITFSKDNT